MKKHLSRLVGKLPKIVIDIELEDVWWILALLLGPILLHEFITWANLAY